MWLVPLADEAGGDLYCYSLRENEIGAIYYWSHEFEYNNKVLTEVYSLLRSFSFIPHLLRVFSS